MGVSKSVNLRGTKGMDKPHIRKTSGLAKWYLGKNGYPCSVIVCGLI